MNKIKRHKGIIIFATIIIFIIIVGQFTLNKSSTSTNTNQSTSATEKVVKLNLIQSISASGTVESANYISITTSVNGIVKKVYVKEGDKVTKNQKIMGVTLDSEGEKSLQSSYASYLRAKNSLADAKNNILGLQNSLIQKQTAFDTIKKTTSYSNEEERNQYKIAENDFNKAKTDFDLQNSQIKTLEISLNNAYLDYLTQSPTILAPSDGIVYNIVAVEGSKIENSVTSDRSIATVASIKVQGSPIISVNITEMDIAKIKVGQKVNVTLNSISNKTFEGEVLGIDKIGTVNSSIANYPVTIKLKQDNENILPNMSVSAQIILNEKSNVLSVPTSAITTNGDKSYVNILSSNGKISEIEVSTGFIGDTSTEITSGLNENQTVVLNSYATSGFTDTSTNSSTRRPGIFSIFGGR